MLIEAREINNLKKVCKIILDSRSDENALFYAFTPISLRIMQLHFDRFDVGLSKEQRYTDLVMNAKGETEFDYLEIDLLTRVVKTHFKFEVFKMQDNHEIKSGIDLKGTFLKLRIWSSFRSKLENLKISYGIGDHNSFLLNKELFHKEIESPEDYGSHVEVFLAKIPN